MTELEYCSKVQYCIKLLKENNVNEAAIQLEALYNIKPVRLNWYTAKALYLWKTTQNAGTALESLSKTGGYLFHYPGFKALTDLYMDLVMSYCDKQDMQRHKMIYLKICENKTHLEKEWIDEMEKDFQQSKCNFLKEPESRQISEILLSYYFIFQDNIMFYLLANYMQKEKMSLPAGREWFMDFPNRDFLTENLSEEAKIPFIIIVDESSDGLDEKILAYLLQQIQKKVYFIKEPILFEVEHEVDLKETAAISLASMKSEGGLYNIYPAEFLYKGENIGDNRELIIAHLLENDIKSQFSVVLTNGTLMDNLCCQPVLKKNLGRLHRFISPVLENQMVFGWAGDYLAYISQIHNIDAEKMLNSSPEVSYSIIVPARNSAHTLRYTLKTCLEQRYEGDYEIVLSDNSTPGNMEVYQLYIELGDPRIKYYRTPREYNLSRSFEFAFLHAKGEFLLSLGSDDALLPWALEVLEELRKVYPNEDIIQWERGFYAWPGFNGGQQHQFTIPRDYRKGEYNPVYYDRQSYFSTLFNNSNQMYLLPNLYLNSGCKKEYLKTILTKTGRLFDGICQDIYMGVVNASINEKILNIRYPLIIAGMADGSMGANANLLSTHNKRTAEFLSDQKKTANIGGYCASIYERLMPEVTTDKSSLYNCILRMISYGVVTESDLEQFDFRKWFLDVFGQMDIRDPFFDKKLHYFRYTASLHGEKFLKWFDETIYQNALVPRLLDEEKITRLQERKCYKEGRGQSGGQTLDASKYNVWNIYDASRLFEKLSGL